jgi:cysteine desulfurase
MGLVYLDNNATTRVDPAVLAAMLPYFTEHYGNASSLHGPGAVAARAIRAARAQVRDLLGASGDREIVFTSGATESNHAALHAGLEARPGRGELVISAVEHPSVLATCRHLERTRGLTVRVVPVDAAGRLDLDAYRRALSERTALVSMMWANNETGTLFDVHALAELAHQAGALFHTDAVQAAGRLPLRVAGSAVDLLSVSSHKLHGPKGVGVLWVAPALRYAPLYRGGRQEGGRRAGTENVPGIVGLGAAAELARAHLADEQTRVRALRDRLELGLLERVPRCQVRGDVEGRLGNTSCLTFERVDGEGLVTLLDREGIAASSGAACASGMTEPSHVLRAMRVPPALALGALRLSLSRDTTTADVERVLEVLPALVQDLRAPSPGVRPGAPREERCA